MIAPSMIKLLHTITRFDMDGLYNLLLFVSESLTLSGNGKTWLAIPYPPPMPPFVTLVTYIL